MSSKRERAYARRRYEKWQARRSAAQARRRRAQVLVGAALGVVVVGVVVTALVLGDRSTSEAVAASASADVTSTVAATDGTSTEARVGNDGELPSATLAEDRDWTGTIELTQGTLDITLDGVDAPQAVANFVTLAAEGYFDDTSCHRLVTSGIYVLQCGDPTGTGSGGPGYSWGPIENAPSDDVYPAGTIAMARVGDDGESMGSQFFIVYQDSTIPSDSAGGYTVFGQVTSGLDVVQAIADAGTDSGTETPVDDVIIQKVETQ